MIGVIGRGNKGSQIPIASHESDDVRLYHLPLLSRVDLGFVRSPGPGLGNLLFPIARAVIGQATRGGTIIFPTMRQFKLGPYLRREKDKRTYGEVLRRRTSAELGAWIRAQLSPKHDEAEADAVRSGVICYRGLGRQFHDLAGHTEIVRKFFECASRESIPVRRYDVAIHVRRGDFALPSSSATCQSVQLPIEWYRAAFARACDFLGVGSAQSVLFSDEDPARIISELGIGGVEPEPRANALESMFQMANADAIIASRSTFSLWAQFLGGRAAIWPVGFDLGAYKLVDETTDFFV